MTQTVQTVLGPLSVDQLGLTLMHEHLKIGYPGWEVDTTLVFDREAELADAIARLERLRALGVSTFVDPCPMELARDPEFMADAARESGIHIVCSTGLYIEQGLELAGFPAYFRALGIEQIQRIYTTELRDGVGERCVRPGVIKCATGPHKVGEHEEKSLRAGARAALERDVRITTHTTMGSMGNEQLDILMGEGLPANHIVIGHCDWNPDTAYHRSLMERGCYIGFDGVGIDVLLPDDTRISNLVELIEAGFERQIVLSHDHIGCWHFRPEDAPPVVTSTQADPKRSYTYLLEEFIPKLQKAGASERAIDTMLVDNPRRYFAGEPL
ncbi:phosphotriesterase-related protein [Myxococcota bacterium]|nr:phosphotriesterase-related protein [Myxococcota bacterium]